MRLIVTFLAGFFALTITPVFSQKLVFKINPDSARKPISPFIYGMNQDYDHAGSKRLGGNRLTGYNWENNASNAGTDWINESDDYEVADQGVSAADAKSPGAVITYFHNKSLNMKAYSLVTLPVAGYVAKDINGPVSQTEVAPSPRWAKVMLRKSAPLSLVPDTTDGSVFLDEELNFLISRFGKSSSQSGIRGYSLDNEPDIWNSTHPLLFGNQPVSVAYLMNQSIQTANLVKDMDPSAEVFGWASYGFNGFLNLQNAPDWSSLKGNYGTFLEYYLEKMKAEELKNGRRILDVLDLHWYPETDKTLNVSPFDDKTDYQSNQLRMDMVRSLWDSSYRENTWIGQEYHDVILPLLPKVKQYIDLHYPQTKLAITEYSYMGRNHASGGIAEADALGVFGKHGLYLATYWGYVEKYIKAGFDLYRNYDGKGGGFGDISVSAQTNNDLKTSVYASAESGDGGKLHIIALNKDQDSSKLVTVSIGGQTLYKSARVFMFDNSSHLLRQLNNIRTVESNSFQVTLPPLSAYHFILTTEDLSVYPYIDSFSINTQAAYPDGKTLLQLRASVTDGDHNLREVALDLSALGDNASQPMVKNGNQYSFDYLVPATATPGLKTLRLSASDSDAHQASASLDFRVIAALPATRLWDGDSVRGGQAYLFYDDADSRIAQMKMNVLKTGGNQGPVNLHLYMIHDPYKWNVFSWRFVTDPLKARDVSNFAYLEFYVRSNAPQESDIDISLQDASDLQNNSAWIALKGNGYISSFNPNSYTRVRIPFSQLTQGVNFDLTKLWQISFHTNTAVKGFDVWLDDIRAIPYPLPSATPTLSAVSLLPKSGYADGTTMITVVAAASNPDKNLKGVYTDLSAVGGKNNQELSYDGKTYQCSYIVPSGLAKGPKTITVFAVDSTGFEADSTLVFSVYQKATTDTIWNGDKIKYGSAWTSNLKTTCLIKTTGGNYGPGVMKGHLQTYAPDTWSGIVWDWNDKSGDRNIRDLSDKRFLSFYVKVAQAPANFDLEVMLKDINAEQSKSVYLKQGGFVSSFTAQYQLVKIPLNQLFNSATIDPSKVTRFVLTAATLPSSGIDVYVDDITASGSAVADVQFTVNNSACANNGNISVDTIKSAGKNFHYQINGAGNPAGEGNPLFSNLAPGSYDIKITGDSNFVFLEAVSVRGNGPLVTTSTVVNGSDVYLTVTGGSGHYGYAWSSGQTTQNVTGLSAGSYSVAILDSSTHCTAGYGITLGGQSGTRASVFPNPAMDMIKVSHSLEGLKKIEVYNVSMQLMKVYTPSGNPAQLDIHSLPKGQYSMKLYHSGGSTLLNFVKL